MLNRGSVHDEDEGRLTGDDIVVAVMTGIGGDRLDSAVGRNRGVDVQPFSSSRRLTTAAVRAGRRIVPMHGLLEVDVTEARGLLGAHEPPLSLTAFVIASVARAAAAHTEVHAYRDWRGRLVRHRHVDVQTLIEVPTCLLYTSDAADEEDSVDLGGRRIIKKKKT